MKPRSARAGRRVSALIAAFLAGVALDSWLRVYGPPKPASASVEREEAHMAPASAVTAQASSGSVATTGTRSTLRVPIDDFPVESMKGGFAEARTGHEHEAVDMLAPRNTPIHAVDDGRIAKLFVSKAGGITIYQFDPMARLCYYYAHLERYAEGLREGQAITRGQVVGYVGTSGNAPRNTPHLHFAVFELNDQHQWWKGQAIDPYPFFKTRG